MAIDIERVRQEIYNYYDSLRNLSRPLVGGLVRAFPDFLDTGDFVYCSDKIEYPGIDGKSFLAGRVVDRRKISHEGHQGIIVRSSPDGIIPFEEYSRFALKPFFTMPHDGGLVANLDSLEANVGDVLFRGKSAQEVVNINFACFPILIDKMKELGPEEYQEFYMRLLADTPLLY